MSRYTPSLIVFSGFRFGEFGKGVGGLGGACSGGGPRGFAQIVTDPVFLSDFASNLTDGVLIIDFRTLSRMGGRHKTNRL